MSEHRWAWRKVLGRDSMGWGFITRIICLDCFVRKDGSGYSRPLKTDGSSDTNGANRPRRCVAVDD